MSDATATTMDGGSHGFRLAPGMRLADRYIVQRGLGHGGMGEVYQVEDTALGEVVALKMLSARLSADPVALSRFQGEVKNARQVGHPNVCRTYEFGVHRDERGDAVHFLTMELLSGETLDARMRRQALPQSEVLELMAQVAAGVDAAHALGIVHRDLKPANVMLVTHSGGGTRAVVTDFGLARQLDESRITREGWVGTPAFVAPEQLAGEPGGTAADIYAFGVMLFEMVTGRLPFEGAGAPQVALQRMARPAPRARSLDASIRAEWDDAIARCLEKDPALRFPRASDAVRAMGGEIPGSSPASHSAPMLRRIQWSRTRRAVVAGSLLVTMAIAVAVAVGVVRDRSNRDTLPAANRVIAVQVRAAPGVAAPELPKELPPFDDAAAWLIRQEWTRLEELRRFRVSPDGSGNVEARLEWAPRGAGVTGAVELLGGGRRVARFEAEAPSIRELAIALHPRVAERVGDGQAMVELFPEERAEMQRWGAPDAQGYKDLKRAVIDAYAEGSIDANDVLVRLKDLVRRYPGWPHAALGLISDLGIRSAEVRSLAARHALLAASSADASGREMLERIAAGQIEQLMMPEQIQAHWQARDMVIDIVDWVCAFEGTDDDRQAWFARLAPRYPNLQWAAGPPSAMEEEHPAWHFRAAGNRQAWLSVIASRALRVGSAESPRGALVWFRRLQGDLPQTRIAVAGIHLARFELDELRALSPTLLATPPVMRAAALAILADEAILRGRLRAAREQHLRAWEAASSAGLYEQAFYWIQSARELMRLEALLGNPRAANDHRRHLIEQWSNFGWPRGVLDAYRWEAERSRTGVCPPLPRSTGTSPTTADREALRLARRAARVAGCATCKEVLADGPSITEELLPWSDVYARCAIELGDSLDEALRMLRNAERFAMTASTGKPDPAAVDVVLAHYWMGRVLERQGKGTEAKARYDRFLKFWGEADIPIPEVDDARKRLEELH